MPKSEKEKHKEVDALINDEDRVEKLRKKIVTLFNGMSDYADKELRDWTLDELLIIREYFGDVLVYDVNRNIDNTLAGPIGNDTIH